MFTDRSQAALLLVEKLKTLSLTNPVVFGIPRGGAVPASIIANELNCDLDLVLSRKLRSPHQPELAFGALGEDGQVYLYDEKSILSLIDDAYLEKEKKIQTEEINRRRAMIRKVLKEQQVEGRSVIVTDDGIATGSTMIAGLHVLRSKHPKELIVAVPVSPADTAVKLKQYCDQVICLDIPNNFWAIGQFYENFSQVDDNEVIEILKKFPKRNG